MCFLCILLMMFTGNISLLDQPKHGFLCSRTTASSAILPCLDWATEMAKGSVPVMSTFHSEIESAVLDLLLCGKCPIILVLGRKMYKVLPERLRKAYDSGRLLIISTSQQSRISKESAFLSNKYICQNSSILTFGFLSHESSLFLLYNEQSRLEKQIMVIAQI